MLHIGHVLEFEEALESRLVCYAKLAELKRMEIMIFLMRKIDIGQQSTLNSDLWTIHWGLVAENHLRDGWNLEETRTQKG